MGTCTHLTKNKRIRKCKKFARRGKPVCWIHEKTEGAGDAAPLLDPTRNLCLGCQEDMGPENPRQFCRKTYCPVYDCLEAELYRAKRAKRSPEQTVLTQFFLPC
jgi:hypothetical protein